MVYKKHQIYNYPVLLPWNSNFDAIYSLVKNKTLLSKERIYYLLSLLLCAQAIEGAIAECGVYKGGSAYALADTIQRYNMKKPLFLLDTFNGVPKSSVMRKDYHKVEDLNDTSLKGVSDLLKAYNFVQIIPGIIPDSLTTINQQKFSFIHLDLDNYLPIKHALNFFYHRMHTGGVILVDDYGFPIYKNSAKKATDDFFSTKQESVVILASGQAFVIKSA